MNDTLFPLQFERDCCNLIVKKRKSEKESRKREVRDIQINVYGPEGKRKRLYAIFPFLVAVSCIVGLFFYYLHFETPAAMRNVVQLEGWSAQTGSMEAPVALDKLDTYIPLAPNERITLTRTMKERAERSGILLSTEYQRVRVLLGEEVLFDNTGTLLDIQLGTSTTVIPLAADYQGKRLEVTVESPYELYATSPDPIYFGDESSLYAWINATSTRDVLFSCILVFSGLVYMLFSLYGFLKNGEARQGQMGFGVFSILLGLSTLTETHLARRAFLPAVSGQLELVLWYLLPIPLLFFLYTRFTVTRKPARVILIIFCAVVAVTLGAALVNAWDLPYALVYMNPIYIALVSCVMVIVMVEWARKNRAIRMFTPAIAVVFLSAALSAINIAGYYWIKEALRVTGLFLLSLLVWVDTLWEDMRKRKQDIMEMQRLRMKSTLMLEQYNAASSFAEEAKMLRHEFNHHLAALQMLSKQGELFKIQTYLDSVIQSDQVLPDQFCEHPLVNAILTKTARDCRKAGIRFSCEAHVPAEFAMLEIDLAGLLFNMLENAVQAASQTEGKDRYVALRLRLKENFLAVSCRNSMLKNSVKREDGRFFSTKPDIKDHGCGMTIMQNIVKKYDSQLNIELGEAEFNVKTILRLTALDPFNSH